VTSNGGTIRFERSGLRSGFGRAFVLDLLEQAFSSIDPARRIFECLLREGTTLRVGTQSYQRGEGRVGAIAIGKAAVPMAAAVSDLLGPLLREGIAVTRYGYAGRVAGFRVLEAGHPLPDENGHNAAAAVSRWADQLGKKDLALCLVSGGGSALLAAPPDGVSIDDLASATRLLLGTGATIDEVNTVRRHLSTLQGGRLARRLRPATVVTLVLSDVIGDRLESIASGPTVPDPTTFAEAQRVFQRHQLWDRIPASVRRHIEGGMRGEIPETPKPGDPVFRTTEVRIIASNETFVEAVCRAGRKAGCRILRSPHPTVGEARIAGCELGRWAKSVAGSRGGRTLIVSGGETTVTVRGNGRGGRNQELALAGAVEIEGARTVCIAAFATDGTDGTTDAAGAVVDGETVDRAGRLGLSPARALEDNDSHSLLAATGDLLSTGPTRTNVADVYLAYVDGR